MIRSDSINKTLQYLLIALGIFVFVEIQVILFVSIDNYIKIHNMNNNQQIDAPDFNGDKRPAFNHFNESGNMDDDISNSVVKPGSKSKTTNEKPSA